MNLFKYSLVLMITILLSGCNAHRVTHKVEFGSIKHHIEIERRKIEETK